MNRPILFVLIVVICMSVSSVYSQDLVIQHGDIEIAGTLVNSKNGTDHPIVILITGSGAQDRDETILGFKPFKIIADSLEQAGVGSFRYDDRGTGGSSGIFNEATLSDLVSDVHAIISHLSTEYGYKQFILLGHSQGGVVALEAASDPKVAGIILMASPTVMMKEVINEQVSSLQALAGKSEDDIRSTLVFQEKVYQAVKEDTGWEEVKSAYAALVKIELDKLPEAQRSFIVDVDAFTGAQYKQQVLPMNNPQFRSLLFHDPIEKFEDLKTPVLAVFGEKDTQVSPGQNKPPLEEACTKYGSKCSIEVFTDANHLFQKANTGLVNEYKTLPKEFVVGFTGSLISWISENL